MTPRPAPPEFEQRVRQPGLRWLEENGIPLDTRVEPGTKIHPYWRACLDDLHRSYEGICAYLCIHVERCTGGTSSPAAEDHLRRYSPFVWLEAKRQGLL